MSEEKSEEEIKLEKETNKEIRKDKFKYIVLCIIIGLILGQVKLGLFDFFGVNEDTEYENTSSTSLVDLPERTFSELTPASINTDAFIPDATESYSYVDLEYKLPDTYAKDIINTTTDTLSYSPGLIDNEQYLIKISVADIPEGTKLEDYFESIENTISSVLGYNTEFVENRSTERFNGKEWYRYKVKYTSTTDKQIEYEEIYFTEYNGKMYEVHFNILRTDGTTPDYDDARNFLNIKMSLNFK